MIAMDAPKGRIVSRILFTAGGAVAWVEVADPEYTYERLFVICRGCGLEDEAGGMAPALCRLVEHAEACEEPPQEEADPNAAA